MPAVMISLLDHWYLDKVTHVLQLGQLPVVDSGLQGLHIDPVQDLQVGGNILVLRNVGDIPNQDQGPLEDEGRAEVGQDLGAPNEGNEVIGDYIGVTERTIGFVVYYFAWQLADYFMYECLSFLGKSTALQVDVSV